MMNLFLFVLIFSNMHPSKVKKTFGFSLIVGFQHYLVKGKKWHGTKKQERFFYYFFYNMIILFDCRWYMCMYVYALSLQMVQYES